MIKERIAGVHKDLWHTLPRLLDRSQTLPGDAEHRVTRAEFLTMLGEVRQHWRLNADFIPALARRCPIASHEVPVSASEPNVRVYLVGQVSRQPKPCILHFHGGGLISGQAKDYLPALQAQALALDCLIASVEYRLAPEAPFPAALQDGYGALAWLHENAAMLGIDPERIGLQGESAGGGIAAMVAIHARDQKRYEVCHQALIYPMLDDRTRTGVSDVPLIGQLRWGAKLNRLGWDAFLNWPTPEQTPPYGAVPARVEKLSGLPSTYIWVGGIDLFVSEDIHYAARLIAQGVDTKLHVEPGVYHAFDVAVPKSPLTQGFRRSLLENWCAVFAQNFDEATLAYFSN